MQSLLGVILAMTLRSPKASKTMIQQTEKAKSVSRVWTKKRWWFPVSFRRRKVPILVLLTLVTLIFIRMQCSFIQVRCHYEQNDGKKQSETEETHEYEVAIGDGEDSAGSYYSKPSLPKVVWLMSYPNSGTSFTMRLVSRGGNRSVATNYGLEDELREINIPLYPNSPNGPFIIGSSRALPPEYILTKTHCGGRCVDCSPEKYIENQTHFLERCAQGSRKNSSFVDQKEITWYDPHLATKAIHIVRNPFDNLVSNFHLDMKHKFKRMKNDSATKYSNDASAFRKWCSDQDLKYISKEKEMLPAVVVEFFEGENITWGYNITIPCHAHFYRYAKVRY